MKTVTTELPERFAKRLEEAGLLAPDAFAEVMEDALRRQAAGEVFEPMTDEEMANFPSMTSEEIQAMMDEFQAEKRREREMQSRA